MNWSLIASDKKILGFHLQVLINGVIGMWEPALEAQKTHSGKRMYRGLVAAR
jgi:hypothetical protein